MGQSGKGIGKELDASGGKEPRGSVRTVGQRQQRTLSVEGAARSLGVGEGIPSLSRTRFPVADGAAHPWPLGLAFPPDFCERRMGRLQNHWRYPLPRETCPNQNLPVLATRARLSGNAARADLVGQSSSSASGGLNGIQSEQRRGGDIPVWVSPHPLSAGLF